MSPLSRFKKWWSTRAKTRLLKTSRENLRSITKAEKVAHPERFSAKGQYFVAKTIKTVTSRTAFITKSLRRDIETGISHTKAAALRAEGRLGYGPRGLEPTPPKSTQTLLLKRKYAKLEFAEKPPTPWAKRPKHRAPKRYPVTEEMRNELWSARERKLNGEFLDEGDWHQMIDQARAVNDPMFAALLKSP
ncbi:MAG: hypothetical protein WBE80_10240 [Methylocella sp.]